MAVVKEDPDQINISRNVRLLLVRDGMSQQELGERLGIKQTNISGRLRGAIDWTIKDLTGMSEVFEVPIDVFLKDPKQLWPGPVEPPSRRRSKKAGYTRQLDPKAA